MTEWTKIPRFPIYEVHPSGAVRNGTKGNVLKPFLRGRYPCVKVRNETGATCQAVHLLVIETLRCARPDGMVCAHLDGDRGNSALDNLAWVTPSENEQHKIAHGRDARGEKSANAAFTSLEVEAVREAHRKGLSLAKIAAIARVNTSTIHKVVLGERYT